MFNSIFIGALIAAFAAATVAAQTPAPVAESAPMEASAPGAESAPTTTHGHAAMQSAPTAPHSVALAVDDTDAIAGPTETGQGAFAAIQEIVALLMEDEATDWSKVDIDGLRRHLLDMDRVTLYADVVAKPVAEGMRYEVTGSDEVRGAIRRMVMAHAHVMSGEFGMALAVESHPLGAVLTVTVEDEAMLGKLKALGFFGVMTLGMHHPEHHMRMARGEAPHH